MCFWCGTVIEVSDSCDDRGAYAAALASLPKAGPRRLHRLLSGYSPQEAWQMVKRKLVSADVADKSLRELWAAFAAEVDVNEIADRLQELDIWATTRVDSGHPKRFASDIDPAPIIFRKGDLLEDHAVGVTVIGTRRCSPIGRSVAHEFGAGLAEAGVTVVSGLALGIDGAAHRGALSVSGTPPVGVVGSGLNVIYPRANNNLWHQVCAAGTLLSEAPIDAKPEPWRFPARNRLLAALADVVVVVESKQAGGSMLTVEEAIRRDVTVMAVPGSVRNPAAAGTNQLISEGCAPACSVDDILAAVSLAVPHHSTPQSTQMSMGVTTDNTAHVDDDTNADNTAKKQKCHHTKEEDTFSSGAPAGSRASGVSENHTKEQNTFSSSEEAKTEKETLKHRILEQVDGNPVSIDSLIAYLEEATPAVLTEISNLEAMGLVASYEGKIMRC